MIFTLLASLAGAQSLDLATLEAAERAENPEFEERAQVKRLESIERLKELLSRGVNEDTKAEMMLRLADLYFEEGLRHEGPEWVDKAAKLYEGVLRNYPRYQRADQATMYLGRAYDHSGRRDLAVEAYKKLVKLYPSSAFVPDAYLRIGEYYWTEDNSFAALKAYMKTATFEDHPRRAYTDYRLAWAYHDVGEENKARTQFEKAATQGEEERVQAAAWADLETLFGVARPFESPPPDPDDCARIEAGLRQQIADQPEQAPELQLQIVQCWARVGDRGRAASELARLEELYGPRSEWAKARDKAAVRRAKDALSAARKVVD